MIQEAYCSYKISKLLKEKGFDESTQFVWYEHLPSQNAVHNSEIGKPKRDYFYWEKEGERNSPWTNNCSVPSYIRGEVYSCPTHQMAMKWLREEKNILIYVYPVIDLPVKNNYYWRWDGKKKRHDAPHIGDKHNYESFEDAVEAALKYSLEKLI